MAKKRSKRQLKQADADRVLAYVKAAKPMFRLENWEVRLDTDTRSDSDTHADITTVAEFRIATLRMGREWETLSDEDKRRVMVHELSHLVIRPLNHYTQLLEAGAEESAWGIWEEGWRVQEEIVTDEVACIMLPFAPPWPAA